MFTKVLIPTDLSAASDELIKYARELKTIGVEEVLLVHILDVRNVGGLDETLRVYDAPKIENQALILKEAGIKTKTMIPLGVPFIEINNIAEEECVDLILVGSHGESMIKEILIGSVADSIIRNIKKPVLVQKYNVIENNKKCELKYKQIFEKIMYATDFSDNAERALEYLDKVVQETKAPVHLVYVQDSSKIHPHLENRLEEFNRIDKERLEQIKHKLCNLGSSSVTFSIPYGIPVSCLLNEAKEVSPTLIIMGNRGRSWANELFIGGVSHNVVRLSDVPVLLIPFKKGNGQD